MAYVRSTPNNINTVEDLLRFVLDELKSVELQFNEQDVLDLRPIGAEPKRPRDGMIVYADGTGWNPGSGAGPYVRRAGAWTPLWT